MRRVTIIVALVFLATMTLLDVAMVEGEKPSRKLAPRTAVDADKWIYTLGYPVFRKDRR